MSLTGWTVLEVQNLLIKLFRVFAKELETESLADLRQRISDNLTSLMSEADQQAELGRALVSNRN